jgi:Mg-chelatase subunit ChlD
MLCCFITGNEATLIFYLFNYTDLNSLVDAIRHIPYCGGNTNTTGGLHIMRTDIFNQQNGDRPDVPNIAILITDGNPTRDVDKLPDEVQMIRHAEIRTVGVGVTSQVSNGHYLRCLYLFEKATFIALRIVSNCDRPEVAH